ncbi:hypothetical protein V8G54_024557 [Vigna mungo]|uniref:Uncharacterized protein n=1 Tax=Vigna mungo TaxID=3915 RepID=A0AAQ3MDE9_VIGMU
MEFSERAAELTQILNQLNTLLPLIILLLGGCCLLLLLIRFFLILWLRQGHLKSTISFLQQKDNPYTLRCTPLSYEIVPHPLKEKGESKVTSKMDGAEETPTVDVDRAQNR